MGDVGGGDHLGQQILQNHKTFQKKLFGTRIVHTSGTFFKNVKACPQNMLIYTEKTTESDKRIQNSSL